MGVYRVHLAGAFFVTRARKNFDAGLIYSAHAGGRRHHRRSDDRVERPLEPTTLFKSFAPNSLSRLGYRQNAGLLTNQFTLLAATICALYKSRWQVELFFKWIKQHLRIKVFYGTSETP